MTKPKEPTKSELKTGRPRSSETPPVDELPIGETWIDQRLRALYEPVLYEPLPEELLRLLEPRKH